jgi:hypothetical protein
MSRIVIVILIYERHKPRSKHCVYFPIETLSYLSVSRVRKIWKILEKNTSKGKLKINTIHITTWSWALSERPQDVRPLNSFPAFHGTRRFNTEFTKTLHLFLSWARPIQSTTPRSILILSTHLRLGLPSGIFPSGFPTNNLYAVLFTPTTCYMARQSHLPRLDYSNYTWRRVQITKLLIMQFYIHTTTTTTTT